MGISTAMIFNGCAKDGATGPAGQKGIDGIDGIDGNANVIGSNSVSVVSSDWTLSSNYYSTSFTLPAITQEVVDKGVVMVYEKLGTSWQAMPYSLDIESRDFTFNVGTVKIWAHNSDFSAPTNPSAQTYRIIAISASNLITHPNVDFKNYIEVKNNFNFPD